jgi:dTDP-4-amino-4,6-dideoxygalactose transaminase
MAPSNPPSHRPPSRRAFLASSGALVAGATVGTPSKARASLETLALNGGPKAVSLPTAEVARWPRYGAAEEEAVLALLRAPSTDPIALLEQEWCAYLGVPYSRSTCNGTSALAQMFFALDLPPGSEILVPSYTFFATIVPMRMFGLVPVFVDIDPITLNFDLEDAKKRLTKNTRAVLPVHWFGLPADMDHIAAWADEKGLILLEDAAHAHGAKLKGKRMGAWGRMGIFSYQTTKPLPAMEGGMSTFQLEDDYARGSALGHYMLPGLDGAHPYKRFAGTGLGLKFHMHPISAELARCQLRTMDGRNDSYTRQLRELNAPLLELPGLRHQDNPRKDMERVYYSKNMFFLDERKAGASRAKIVAALRAEGVDASVYEYRLQHEQPLYAEAEWWHHAPVIPELPGTAQANATSIAMPLFTTDAPELVQQYTRAFEKVWAHRKELG